MIAGSLCSLSSTCSAVTPYDLSSFDQRDPTRRGIHRVRQLDGSTGPTPTPLQSNSAATTPGETGPPVVMATVMQATQTAAMASSAGGGNNQGLGVPRVAVGPRGVLPWKSVELAHRLEVSSGNEFGLDARMVRRFFCFLILLMFVSSFSGFNNDSFAPGQLIGETVK